MVAKSPSSYLPDETTSQKTTKQNFYHLEQNIEVSPPKSKKSVKKETPKIVKPSDFDNFLTEMKGGDTFDPFAVTLHSNFAAPSLYEAPSSKPIGLNFEKILHQGEAQDSFMFD